MLDKAELGAYYEHNLITRPEIFANVTVENAAMKGR
jgi:hypothetical protein